MPRKIKEKRSKRLSPYSETDIWERDELLSVVKYEPHKRNKAALALFWDLDARNHEVTALKIKNIRLRERYAEGEVPVNTKTGGGPILLSYSFPYVRDWLNEHPFRNDAEARLICSLRNGKPVKPEAMWTMMKQLRRRLVRMLDQGVITDPEERERIEFLLKTKKWNPYCIRHSAITADSDYLPEYALKKKVRLSMNSKQGTRYIKRRMGNDLKRLILSHSGISTDEINPKLRSAVLDCPKCGHVNALENKYCSNPECSYPLSQQALDEIKAEENAKVAAMERKYEDKFNEMERKLRLLYQKVDPEILADLI